MLSRVCTLSGTKPGLQTVCVTNLRAYIVHRTRAAEIQAAHGYDYLLRFIPYSLRHGKEREQRLSIKLWRSLLLCFPLVSNCD